MESWSIVLPVFSGVILFLLIKFRIEKSKKREKIKKEEKEEEEFKTSTINTLVDAIMYLYSFDKSNVHKIIIRKHLNVTLEDENNVRRAISDHLHINSSVILKDENLALSLACGVKQTLQILIDQYLAHRAKKLYWIHEEEKKFVGWYEKPKLERSYGEYSEKNIEDYLDAIKKISKEKEEEESLFWGFHNMVQESLPDIRTWGNISYKVYLMLELKEG